MQFNFNVAHVSQTICKIPVNSAIILCGFTGVLTQLPLRQASDKLSRQK